MIWDAVIGIAFSLVLSAALLAISEALRPKDDSENLRPKGLGDFQFPTAQEGRPVPIVWGTCRLKGPNVVWYGDLVSRSIKERIKTGLFSSKSIVTGFQYFVGIQMAFCRGPIDALTRIWIGDREVFNGSLTGGPLIINEPNLFGGNDHGTGGVSGTFRLELGTETQTASAYLTANQTPAVPLRGTCHGTLEGMYIGNSTSIKPWSVEVRRIPNQLGILGGRELVNGFDANPAAVIYELLTDTDFGRGLDPAKIDAADFRTAADTLHAEGNGFSMVLDTFRDHEAMSKEVERQIDGHVYSDPVTGLIKLKLVRADYDVNTVPEISPDTSLVEVRNYAPQTWAETSNQVRVFFTDRDRDYFNTYATAPDVGNFFLQGEQHVPLELKFPGVKDRTLAATLAAREQRGRGIPLSTATVVVDRSLHSLVPGDVVTYTDPNLGLTKLPMRALNIDRGTLLDGKLTMKLVQDVFSFLPPVVAPPDNTLWTPPTQDVLALPADEQLAFEAPRAFVTRDPAYPGVGDRIWSGGRRQTGFEASIGVYQRNASGVPAGAYTESGRTFEFFKIGTLGQSLTGAEALPMGTLQLDSLPDTVADMFEEITQSAATSDLGQNLVNLLLVGDEFMAMTGAIDQGTHIDLVNVYRGLLDTVPQPHTLGDDVYLIFVAGGLSDDTITAGNNVDVKLRPRGRFGEEVAEIDAVTIQFQMDDRVRRPYAPVELDLNGSRFASSVNFDTLRSGGSTLDDRGIECDYLRRDFRTTDEVASLLTDAATLDPTFPSTHSTVYSLEIIDDPGGSPSSLLVTSFADAAQLFASRTKLLRATAGVVPTTLRAEITARHTFEGGTFDSRTPLGWTFSLAASSLDDDTNLGNLNDGVISPVYVAPTTGTYTFNLGTALATGIVEARINGGSFVTVIPATQVTGTLVGVTASDTIEVRHTQGGSDTTETFLEIQAPSSTQDAYAIVVI